MMRSIVALLTAGVVGIAVTGVVFSLVLPLVLMAVKLAFFVGIVYLILRLVNPDFAEKLKEKCCGAKS